MATATYTAADVMEVRAQSGVGMMECKRALADAKGDKAKALILLRERGHGPIIHEGREATEGYVGSYIHQGGKIGVLVDLGCETDFVARNSEFQKLAREIAMHIAFANPTYQTDGDIPVEVIEAEREIATNLARNEGKLDSIVAKIVEGRLQKFKDDNCLLTQTYCRDAKKKVGDLVQELRARMRENISVKRFIRFEVGR